MSYLVKKLKYLRIRINNVLSSAALKFERFIDFEQFLCIFYVYNSRTQSWIRHFEGNDETTFPGSPRDLDGSYREGS